MQIWQLLISLTILRIPPKRREETVQRQRRLRTSIPTVHGTVYYEAHCNAVT